MGRTPNHAICHYSTVSGDDEPEIICRTNNYLMLFEKHIDIVNRGWGTVVLDSRAIRRLLKLGVRE